MSVQPKSLETVVRFSRLVGEPRSKKIAAETASIRPGDVVLMYNDGFETGIDISQQFDLLREHPLVIADYLLTHFVRPDDDALVLVAR
jgi:hypothetical protein